MERPIQVDIRAFAFANTPILQHSNTPRKVAIFPGRAMQREPPQSGIFNVDEIDTLNGYYRRGAMTVKILVADDEQEIRDLLD
ncbi:MAG: hypothetical protein PVI74_16225, partial [Syntrophobacterales bacterium]